MRIAVMGTGGVGGYFGGLLARNGEDVTFIARGQHLEAMRRDGLRVESVHGDFIVRPVQATDRPAELGPVDVVIFATKTYQLDDAARAMLPLVGPETVVLPLHNGVDAVERTAEFAGPEHVLGGLCYVGSMVAAPGVIRQQSPFRRVIVGEMPWPSSDGSTPQHGTVTPRAQRIVDALAAAGATAEASTDIQAARWTKFAFIAPFSGVGAVTRVPAGEINATPETRALLHAAIAELVTVAAAEGVRLPDEPAKTMAFCDALAPHITASMQRDVLDGKPSELESMIGVVVRKGEALGVPVPSFRYFYASLLPQERAARGIAAPGTAG